MREFLHRDKFNMKQIMDAEFILFILSLVTIE